MNLNFRQGLVSFQTNSSSSPAFLSSSTTSGYLDLVVSPTPFIVAIAHGSTDYLVTFEATIQNAWGELSTTQDSFLYIAIDILTGQARFGVTTMEPIVSSQEPQNVAAGQTWFDLTTNQTMVRNNTNTKFVPSPRVFVATVHQNNFNTIDLRTPGTQVGLNTPSNPGYIILDEALRPLRNSSGELLTTDSPVRIKTTHGTSGILALPTNAFIPVWANEAIPSMSLVYFVGADTVALASSDPSLTSAKTPIGIIKHGLAQNDIGSLVQYGEVTWDQWNWPDSAFGKPLYSGPNGQIVSTRPAGVQVYRVGFVKNKNTILLGIDSETQAQVYSAPGAIINGATPIEVTDIINSFGENVTTISIQPATINDDGYMTAVQAIKLEGLDGRITTNEGAIITLQTSKADVGHTHIATDITDLQALLDGKFNIGDNFDDRYAMLNHDHDDRYALILHTHPISQVDFLQDALDGKSAIGHIHPISEVTNLQLELDNRAYVNHTHAISNVSGLQTALDNKAPIAHTHTIANVLGLQPALDDKAAVTHTHVAEDMLGGTAGYVLTSSGAGAASWEPVAVGCDYCLLPSTTISFNGQLMSTWTLFPNATDMQHLVAYQTQVPGAMANSSQVFDTLDVPTLSSFPSNVNFYIQEPDGYFGQSGQGARTISSSPNITAYEFRLDVDPAVHQGFGFIVGCAGVDGPPWDSNNAGNTGNSAKFYGSATAALVAAWYPSLDLGLVSNFSINDRIGMVVDDPNSMVYFFHNGTYVGNGQIAAGGGGRPFCAIEAPAI